MKNIFRVFFALATFCSPPCFCLSLKSNIFKIWIWRMESCNSSISLYIWDLIILYITSCESQWLCLQGYHCFLKRLHGPKETTLFCPLAFYVKQVSWWNADKILSCFLALKNCSTMLMLVAQAKYIERGFLFVLMVFFF